MKKTAEEIAQEAAINDLLQMLDGRLLEKLRTAKRLGDPLPHEGVRPPALPRLMEATHDAIPAEVRNLSKDRQKFWNDYEEAERRSESPLDVGEYLEMLKEQGKDVPYTIEQVSDPESESELSEEELEETRRLKKY